MNNLPELVRAALSEVKGQPFTAGAQSDLISAADIDSIEFVELFFKLEQKLKIELEFSDLKIFCRAKRKGDELKICIEDVIEYISSLKA